MTLALAVLGPIENSLQDLVLVVLAPLENFQPTPSPTVVAGVHPLTAPPPSPPTSISPGLLAPRSVWWPVVALPLPRCPPTYLRGAGKTHRLSANEIGTVTPSRVLHDAPPPACLSALLTMEAYLGKFKWQSDGQTLPDSILGGMRHCQDAGHPPARWLGQYVV